MSKEYIKDKRELNIDPELTENADSLTSDNGNGQNEIKEVIPATSYFYNSSTCEYNLDEESLW